MNKPKFFARFTVTESGISKIHYLTDMDIVRFQMQLKAHGITYTMQYINKSEYYL